MSYLRANPVRATPQSERADPRQVANNAGGFAFTVDPWTHLNRFLILGSQGGTYYVGQDRLTDECTALVNTLLDQDATRVVAAAVEISDHARAVKQDYALFALALAAAHRDPAVRRLAYQALPTVCRTASTLFQFLSYLKNRRTFSSRGLRTALARWYNSRAVDQLAFQMVKYRERHGFSHNNVLNLSHPNPKRASFAGENTFSDEAARTVLYRWATGYNDYEVPALPEVVANMYRARACDEASRADYARKLPREALPTEWLNDPKVWDALLHGEDGRGMPMTALIRNLANLSRCGLLTANSDAARYVVGEIVNVSRIRQSRVHPMALFLAARVYGQGFQPDRYHSHGRAVTKGVERPEKAWAPVGAVVDALEAAFEDALVNVEPTGKPILVAVDSSASMGSHIAGMPVSARDASLAFAFVVARTEPQSRFVGFTDHGDVFELKIAGDERLRDFVSRFEKHVSGRGTDCALPMQWAISQGFNPAAVVEWTDSETWSGREHVHQALNRLRQAGGGHRTKLVVAATTATNVSVGDPNDADTFNVAGFDATVPQVIGEFITGSF